MCHIKRYFTLIRTLAKKKSYTRMAHTVIQ